MHGEVQFEGSSRKIPVRGIRITLGSDNYVSLRNKGNLIDLTIVALNVNVIDGCKERCMTLPREVL